MKTIEERIREDIDRHEQQNPADHPIGIEYEAGFLAGLKRALGLSEKLPDWEEVCERLMEVITIHGDVFDSMPSSMEDMLSEDQNARIDEAFEAYKSAHAQMISE